MDCRRSPVEPPAVWAGFGANTAGRFESTTTSPGAMPEPAIDAPRTSAPQAAVFMKLVTRVRMAEIDQG